MTPLQEVKAALKEPITDVAVLQHRLSTVIQQIQSSSSSSSASSTNHSTTFEKSIAAIQILVIENVLPAWSTVIEQEGEVRSLVEVCFAPLDSLDVESGDSSREHGRNPKRSYKALAAAYSGYQTLSSSLSSTTTSPHLFNLILTLTSTLVRRYSLHDLWSYAFDFSSTRNGERGGSFVWEESVKLSVALPARVMNAYGRAREAGVQGVGIEEVDRLNGQTYFSKLVGDLEELMLETSQDATDQDIAALSYALTRLIRTGLLIPPTPSSSLDPHPSFFTPIFPSLLRHLSQESSSSQGPVLSQQHYKPGFWPRLLSEMQESDIAAVAWSFLLHLSRGIHPSGTAPDRAIAQAATYLERFLGSPVGSFGSGKGKQKETAGGTGVKRTTELYEAFVDSLLMRGKGREGGGEEAVEVRCRIVVGWVAKGGEVAVKNLIGRVMEVWTDPKSIKYSLFAWQLYITQLLLLALSQLPPYHPYLMKISFESSFLASMQEYLSHSGGAIRRLGMLVAEVLSELTIPDDQGETSGGRRNGKAERDAEVEELEKMLQSLGEDGESKSDKSQHAPSSRQRRRLEFGKEIWAGFGHGKEECRRLRAIARIKDSDVGANRIEGQRADGMNGQSWELLGWDRVEGPLPSTIQPGTRNTQVSEQDPHTRGRSPSPNPPVKTKPPRPQPDSDDESLSGYSSSANSSRSPSPTPSYLDEVAKDPMSNTTTKEKVQRPVYIIQLIELLRAREDPDKLEVGLKWGESLIRRKRHFGKELKENSIFLSQVLCALSDPYDLEEFEERRQSMLVALTACVPKRVAPYLIEQYFIGQYSLTQRSAILTALSMAARELAGFSTLPRPNIPKQADFPSKVLPPALHDRYLSEQDLQGAAHAALLLQAGKENVVDLVLKKKVASDGSNTVQSRQRQLRAGTMPTRQSSGAAGLNAISENINSPVIPFKDIAAEYFILPMINGFWTYFQDELARESRASYERQGMGVGTGMILSPMALSHFISALTIMLHAARHSPAFLAVLAPEALELAIAMGTQLAIGFSEVPALAPPESPQAALEADVVSASLELALVCLIGSKELDNGRSLVREHMTSVMAAAEWATGVFGREQKGETTSSHKGGPREDRIGRTAANIVLTVTDIVEAVQGRLPMAVSQALSRI